MSMTSFNKPNNPIDYDYVTQGRYSYRTKGRSIGSFGAASCTIVAIINSFGVFVTHLDVLHWQLDKELKQLVMKEASVKGAHVYFTVNDENENFVKAISNELPKTAYQSWEKNTSSLVVDSTGKVMYNVGPPKNMEGHVTAYINAASESYYKDAIERAEVYQQKVNSGLERPEAPGPNYFFDADQWKWRPL